MNGTSQYEKQEIEAIIGGIDCPKDFRCYKSGFKDLCKAQDFGVQSFIVCLEEDQRCKFSYAVGSRRFCQCPLRGYLIKKLKR